jgi:hypothetical protein
MRKRRLNTGSTPLPSASENVLPFVYWIIERLCHQHGLKPAHMQSSRSLPLATTGKRTGNTGGNAGHALHAAGRRTPAHPCRSGC